VLPEFSQPGFNPNSAHSRTQSRFKKRDWDVVKKHDYQGTPHRVVMKDKQTRNPALALARKKIADRLCRGWG
jgi:hypothetical protein